MTRLIVATFPDRSQVLVTEWGSGAIEVAKRPSQSARWSPPSFDVRIEEEDES